MKPKSALRSFLALTGSSLLAISYSHAVTYDWDASNVTGATPPATLDWFTGGSNPLGLWTGPVVPVSASDTTIRFFADITTSLPNTNTTPVTQTVNLNNGGSAFQLGTLALNGFGSTVSGAVLTMTLQGDALNFSGATGTITFDGRKNTAPATDPVINYTINNNVQLGTAGSASALTINGNGDGSSPSTTTYTIGGAISELQAGGGSILKSGTNTVNISGALSITGAVTVSVGQLNLTNSTNTASSFTVSGGTLNVTSSAISASTMTVNGGTLILTGNHNPVSGSMTVNSGGILRIGNNTATQFGPAGVYAGNISTGTGGTLQLWSSSNQTLSGIISGSGGINKAYGGTLTLSGLNTYTGQSVFKPQTTTGFTANVSSFDYITSGTYANHGLGSSLGAPTTVPNGTIDVGSISAQAGTTLNYTGSGETTDRVLNFAGNDRSTSSITTSGGGLLKFTSNVTVTPLVKIALGGTGNGEISGNIGVTSGALTKSGAGTWTLSGTNGITGATTISAGTLRLGSATALQNSPFVTASVVGAAAAGLRIDTTTLTLGGLTGANALRGRFTTALGGPSNATVQGGYDGLTALTLNTVAGASHTYTGAIVNGATGMTLTKTGFGTQFLNNANTYTGLTTVSQGTLAGNGSFTGAVSLDNNTSVALSPGATAGAVGTLTISDASASALTLNGNRLNFDVVGVGTSDKIAITGNLVLNGTNTVLLNLPAAGIAASTNIDLMTYANKTGDGSLVFANGLPTMGSLTLVANATTNAQLQVGAGGLNHSVWSGATGVWDGGATNWTRNGVATQAYVAGDFVTFNDLGTTLTVTSAGTVSPASVTVNNSTKAYIINATIGGADTPLIKSGASSLTLGGTNTFGGGLFLDGGTVNVNGATDSLGAAGSTITVLSNSTLNQGGNGAISLNKNLAVNGGTLTFVHGNNSWTIQGIVSGSNTIKVNDAGGINQRPLNLINTANTFTGAIDLLNSNSTITVASLGDTVGSGNIIFGAGNSAFQLGTTAVAPLALSNRVFEFRGGTSTGQINNNNTASSNTLTINSDLSVTTAGTKTLLLGGTNTGVNTFAGDITNGSGGGTVALTKAGLSVSTWALSGTNTYSGKTTVGHTFPGPSTLIFQGKQAVSPNTTFETSQSAGAATRLVFLDDSAGLISLNNSWTFRNGGDGQRNTAIFVGNNNTANGGTSASTQTNSTIALGGYISFPNSISGSASDRVDITGANGYKLQLASIAFPNISGRPAASSFTINLNPTSATLIVAGGVTPFASTNANSTPVLNLDGTATGNEIQGAIANPSNAPATSNPLSLTKSNTSTWTLTSTANTYTGTTTISGGTLAGIGANAFGNTTGISIAAASTATLSLRGDSSTNFVKASDSSLYAVTTTANGATINVDAATGVTTAKTMTIGTLALNNAVTNGTNFTGSNNTSLSIGAVTTSAAASGTETLTNNIASTGSLTLSSLAVNRTGTPTLVFNGTGNTTVAGAINGTLATALTYSGTGTLLLNGINTYTGLTNVTTGTLGGTGTIAGAVTVLAAGSLAPGASGAGTLSIGGVLNISAQANAGAGKLKFELGPIASSDKIALTGSGSLTIGGTFLGFNDFNFSTLSGLQNGTYKLITSANAISGGLDTTPANLTGPIGAGTGVLQITGNDVELVVTGVGASSAYDTWKALNAPSGNPNDDYDGDGVSNAVEFVLGGLASTNDLSKLPTLTTSGGNMIFNFKRAQSSIDPKTAVFIEVGTNLVIWNVPSSPYTVPDIAAAGPPLAVVKNNPSAGTDNVTLTLPQAPDAKKFARLKVVITP